MNAASLITLSAAVLAAGLLHAQIPVDPLIEPVAPAEGQIPAIPEAPGLVPPAFGPHDNDKNDSNVANATPRIIGLRI